MSSRHTDTDALCRMYHHSPQTFLSLTAQRARHSATRQTLYDDPDPHARVPAATTSTEAHSGKVIQFTELDDGAVGRLWADMRRSLGEH